ncbi:MAG: hypothetical protein FWD99_09995, partial [Oscillospiraceae bacterium]|nr:hypothetical protein [Oscillospiraceae bacterium]
IQYEQQYQGLVGFEGAYALARDDSPVSVIVFFDDDVAAVQVLQAQMEGYVLTERAADQIVEDSHVLFRQELYTLFGLPSEDHRAFAAGVVEAPFQIRWEYRYALLWKRSL